MSPVRVQHLLFTAFTCFYSDAKFPVTGIINFNRIACLKRKITTKRVRAPDPTSWRFYAGSILYDDDMPVAGARISVRYWILIVARTHAPFSSSQYDGDDAFDSPLRGTVEWYRPYLYMTYCEAVFRRRVHSTYTGRTVKLVWSVFSHGPSKQVHRRNRKSQKVTTDSGSRWRLRSTDLYRTDVEHLLTGRRRSWFEVFTRKQRLGYLKIDL